MTDPIHHGDIWLVDLNPTRGAELQKVRPAVVLSVNAIGKLPIKLIAPITAWQESFKNNLWHIELQTSQANGLNKLSAIDALQIRSVDTSRFKTKLGKLELDKLEDLQKAVMIVIGFSL